MHHQRQPQLLMLLQRQQLPLLVVASSQVAAAAAGAAHAAAAGARRTVRGAGALLLDACGQRSWHRESRLATCFFISCFRSSISLFLALFSVFQLRLDGLILPFYLCLFFTSPIPRYS